MPCIIKFIERLSLTKISSLCVAPLCLVTLLWWHLDVLHNVNFLGNFYFQQYNQSIAACFDGRMDMECEKSLLV